jgi:hypothetical protein
MKELGGKSDIFQHGINQMSAGAKVGARPLEQAMGSTKWATTVPDGKEHARPETLATKIQHVLTPELLKKIGTHVAEGLVTGLRATGHPIIAKTLEVVAEP